MSQQQSPIIGIDLGTTNSVVAAYIDGKVQVIHEDGEDILPSIVGLTMDGKLVVGRSAKNQLAVFPDRTIASVKRRMGEAIRLKLADQDFTPQEISAMILRRLKHRAEAKLGTEVTRAVITVPAFFDDNQRQATREAGALAGLTVERIINEPTAASLVYVALSDERRHLIAYDLGGGTFDVSIVRVEAGVVEVLSSKGDTHLGGDDFDQLLTKFVADRFYNQHSYDLMEHASTRWRLMQACERAKCELSFDSVFKITEEFIATIDGQPVNLEIEVTREEYEALIAPLVERTIGCVDAAIRDAGVSMAQVDELILVGGSTRTPLVQRRLREEFDREPKWAVNPDLAVALGAAMQAAMQQGYDVGPVLIDVATHTLGVATLHTSLMSAKLVFHPILFRNSPLPARYEDVFYKVTPAQQAAIIEVYQGESRELEHNAPLGRFILDGLDTSDTSNTEILIRFELTLDGVLKVTAVERDTGKTKTMMIENALAEMGKESRQATVDRLDGLFEGSEEFASVFHRFVDSSSDIETTSAEWAEDEPDTHEATGIRRVDAPSEAESKLGQLVTQARALQPTLKAEDAADVERLLELISQARKYNKPDLLPGFEEELDDLLFYLAQ